MKIFCHVKYIVIARAFPIYMGRIGPSVKIMLKFNLGIDSYMYCALHLYQTNKLKAGGPRTTL